MLARSGGFARCGHCHQVFDARGNLLDPHPGTHDVAQEPTPATSPDTDGAAQARDEYREHAPDAGPQAVPAAAEAESSADQRAPSFAEPPMSAEVPPFVAPVFAPEGVSAPADEAHETRFDVEAESRARAWPDAESAPLNERATEPPFEPEPEAEAAPEAESAPEAEFDAQSRHEHEAGPLHKPEAGQPSSSEGEPLSGSEAEALSEPGAEPPSESDAGPRPEGAVQPVASHDAGPYEGGEPPVSERFPAVTSASEPPYVTPVRSEPVEPAVDERTPSTREADWASHWHDDEPRLTGGVRSDDAEPRFGVASEDPRVRAAGAPPLFAQPPVSSERDRHFAVTREARARSPRRALGYLVGGIVAVALVVVLIAQLAWWRREAVMVYWPDSQALFVRVCARLGCQILPPRDIDGLQVEASDLRQIDGPHRLELRVPLRNRYGIALAYPAIELTLFDSKNDVAIRRILWPQDYLPPGTAVAGGLPAHTTRTMIVRLDSGDAIATNFRVQIFYP